MVLFRLIIKSWTNINIAAILRKESEKSRILSINAIKSYIYQQKNRRPYKRTTGRGTTFFHSIATASLSADTDATDNGVSRYFLLITFQKYCSEATFSKFPIRTLQQMVRSLG